MQLTSPDNPKIKLVRKLASKKARDEHSCFVIEGPHLLAEALKNNALIEFAVCTDKADKNILALLQERGAELYEADDLLFSKLSGTENHQGILAVIKKSEKDISGIKAAGNSMILVCDAIQDPGNLGTLIRSAAAAGCAGVVISGDSVDLYNPKTVRATGGNIFQLPVYTEQNLTDAVKLLKEKGFKVLGAASGQGANIYDYSFSGRFAIIIGNEGAGIKPEILALCDEMIMIPMKEGVESLNAAVSAAVIMFEASRQTNGK